MRRIGGCQNVGFSILDSLEMPEVSNNVKVIVYSITKVPSFRLEGTGTVGTLDDHIASCQFALVPCPNKCEEDKGAGELLLLRKHLDQHLKTKCPKRTYECLHCGEKGTFVSITERPRPSLCEEDRSLSPNKGSGCSLSMERGKTKEYVSSDCEYTE